MSMIAQFDLSHSLPCRTLTRSLRPNHVLCASRGHVILTKSFSFGCVMYALGYGPPPTECRRYRQDLWRRSAVDGISCVVSASNLVEKSNPANCRWCRVMPKIPHAQAVALGVWRVLFQLESLLYARMWGRRKWTRVAIRGDSHGMMQARVACLGRGQHQVRSRATQMPLRRPP